MMKKSIGNIMQRGNSRVNILPQMSKWIDPDLGRLIDSNSSWFENRSRETDLIFALPDINKAIASWRILLQISDQEFMIEEQFSQICHRMEISGVNCEETFQSCYSYQLDKLLDTENLKANFNLNWSDEFYAQVNNFIPKVDDIHHRMMGAAGWMICNATFRSERDHLKLQWEQLPAEERPPFPHARTPQFQSSPSGHQQASVTNRLNFIQAFDQFCDHWRLLGMVTWNLPNPDGPKTSGCLLRHSNRRDGEELMDIPWHFPLLEVEGVGTLLRERHARRAIKHGFIDQKKWQSYAHILAIYHWEQTIRARYSAQGTPDKFVGNLLNLLSQILEIETDRVKKLRTALTSFLQGERTSLDGFR